jgi:hypothetical protein
LFWILVTPLFILTTTSGDKLLQTAASKAVGMVHKAVTYRCPLPGDGSTQRGEIFVRISQYTSLKNAPVLKTERYSSTAETATRTPAWTIREFFF